MEEFGYFLCRQYHIESLQRNLKHLREELLLGCKQLELGSPMGPGFGWPDWFLEAPLV